VAEVAATPITYRGSRKHVLDWTARPSFLRELEALLAPCPLRTTTESRFMPQGPAAPREARLESFGPAWLPGHPAWPALVDWWLAHPAGANTPNWDIAVGCEIEGRPGLALVEAKANWPELGKTGKRRSAGASARSAANHERIGRAIDEACLGWRRLNPRVSISRDSHYQLANRLAFTWKLASLGIPVVLMYVGFIGDEGIRNAGRPFSDDADWRAAFTAYVSGAIPVELFERKLVIGSSSVRLMLRSRPVIGVSPERPLRGRDAHMPRV
jgi:hypothetical protein